MSSSLNVRSLRVDCRRLRRQLSAIRWICQGSVIKRSYQRPTGKNLKTYGPYYSWTRKINNKTVTVALSLTQYRAMQSALASYRRVQVVLDKMRRLSEQAIFATTLGVAKRKR